jgi:hypothetical protein
VGRRIGSRGLTTQSDGYVSALLEARKRRRQTAVHLVDVKMGRGPRTLRGPRPSVWAARLVNDVE